MNSRGMIAGMMLLIGLLFVWRPATAQDKIRMGSELGERPSWRHVGRRTKRPLS